MALWHFSDALLLNSSCQWNLAMLAPAVLHPIWFIVSLFSSATFWASSSLIVAFASFSCLDLSNRASVESLSLSALKAFAFSDHAKQHFRFCTDWVCLVTWALVQPTLPSSSLILCFSALIFWFILGGIPSLLDASDREEWEDCEGIWCERPALLIWDCWGGRFSLSLWVQHAVQALSSVFLWALDFFFVCIKFFKSLLCNEVKWVYAVLRKILVGPRPEEHWSSQVCPQYLWDVVLSLDLAQTWVNKA